MEELEGPGISIAFIRLIKANVELGNPEGKREYNLRLVGFGRQISPDDKHLDILASFDLMCDVADPLFKLTCDFLARYQRQGTGGLPWEKFTPAMALAHIIPYLREFVSNTTSRLLVPVLMLTPFNTYQMFNDYENKSRKNEQTPVETRTGT